MRRVLVFALAFAPASVLALGGVACSKKPSERAPAPAPPPSLATTPVVVGKVRLVAAETGSVVVAIDAPLEKFRGETKKVLGAFDLDPTRLTATTGELSADLDAFVTTTFHDADKDESQTEHARNWFEIGADVEKKWRDDYRWARFTIERVEKASVAALADAKAVDGVRSVRLTVRGSLRVHGRAASKTVELELAFAGPPDAPTGVKFATVAPFAVSLAEHDVKPRDVTGRFLAGALEKVGKKLDDRAEITVSGSASAQPSVMGSASAPPAPRPASS